MSTRWRDIGIALTLLFFAAVFAVGPGAILATQEIDARTVERLAATAQAVDGHGSYHFTALIASYLSGAGREAFVLATGILFILLFYRRLRTAPMVAVAGGLMVAPIVLFLCVLVKDSFVPWVVAASLVVLSCRLPRAVRFAAVLLLYGLYGLVFRSYWFLIAVVFALAVWWRGSSRASRLLFVMLVVVLLWVAPEQWFSQLQGSRDFLNRNRIGRLLPGARTAFMNPYPPDNMEHFTANYLYAVLRLNLPVLFAGIGLREVYLMASMASLTAFMVVGLRQGDDEVALPATLFLAHLIVLQFFEPDLGSYLRHASSAMLYLAPAMARVDAHWRWAPHRFGHGAPRAEAGRL